jgi:hypothetical protein
MEKYLAWQVKSAWGYGSACVNSYDFFYGQPYLVHPSFEWLQQHIYQQTKYLDSVSSEHLATFVKVICFQEEMPLLEHSSYRPH